MVRRRRRNSANQQPDDGPSADIKIYFSDFFEVEPEIVEEYGAFNISLVNDLPLFIDPFLLFNSHKPEYQALHEEIIKYVRFLKEMSLEPDIAPGHLAGWFQFPEVKQTWLGYSLIGNQGRGLGRDFALTLHGNLNNVFTNFGNEAITKGSHLEKFALIKDGVGKDNISDLTTNLIKGFLLTYTQEFAVQFIRPELRRKVSVAKVRFNYHTQTWEDEVFDLPYYLKDYILLTPKDMLTKIDIWINRQDFIDHFDEIKDAVPNEQRRAEINSYFNRRLADQDSAGRLTKEEIAQRVSELIRRYPELLDYYIRYKEEQGDEAKAVSEERVTETESLFIEQVIELVDELLSTTPFYQTEYNTYTETHERLAFFKDVIENKGGHRLFYLNGEPLKRESDLQILFRLVWFASVSDVSREVNDGRGPVDYKISRGSDDKTLVEFKLATNSKLRSNLEHQTPIYEKASDAPVSIKAILYFTEAELERVQSILSDLNLVNHRDIVLIDARNDNKPSGSTA